jgi:dolichol-phosphate mannosyltransferase
MEKQPTSLSVVVPVYNEAGNIAPLAAEVAEALAGQQEYELIFVDDGSSDATADQIRAVMENDPHVRVATHAVNRGQSAGVRTGVLAARSPVIAVLDGDGQNDPHDFPMLLEMLESEEGLGLVIGQRTKRKDSWLRILSSRVANAVRSSLLGDGVSDTGCGIKVFYRDQFLDLPAFNHMHRFLPALIRSGGSEVASVPVNHRPRNEGQSKYGVNNRLWVGIVDLLGVMWLQRRRI